MRYFISAIGTDSGKTLVSAILVEALGADYWKPIQAGPPRDTDTVKRLISNVDSTFHPEAYFLKTPASPHSSAKIDGLEIKLDALSIPKTSNDLIIEGAGGLMVPLNDSHFIVDLPVMWKIPVVLVANLYLGSINHTLLSVDCLKKAGIQVKGLIFNGPSNPESEEVILKYSGYKNLLKIPQLDTIGKGVIRNLSDELLKNWNE